MPHVVFPLRFAYHWGQRRFRVPLYEYVCRKCSRQFEELVFGDSQPSCPSCQSKDLERLLSVVAVGKEKPDVPPSPCGSCCHRGGCGMS